MFNILRASIKTGQVTVPYPELSVDEPCRGRPQIDAARCEGSGACASICPSGAISVSKTSSDRRWQIDLARCVFCGLCADACPGQAITMTNDFEMATCDRSALKIRSVHSTIASSADCRRAHVVNEDDGVPFEQSGLKRAGEQLGDRIRGLLKCSLHIRHMAAGSDNSSDWEIAHLLNPVYDIQRLGIDFVASPRHADLLLVTGAVTRHLEPALRATYEAMPSPRLVVAVGVEACGGGVLQGSYAVAGGVDRCLPVDVYIPGDPPRPQAIIQGLLIALDRMEPKLKA